jgi:hypothetical protein
MMHLCGQSPNENVIAEAVIAIPPEKRHQLRHESKSPTRGGAGFSNADGGARASG